MVEFPPPRMPEYLEHEARERERRALQRANRKARAMQPITPEIVRAMASKATPVIVNAIVTQAPAAYAEFGIKTLNVSRMLFAHILVESTYLTKVFENLDYTAKRLREVFPTHFTPAQAAAMAHDQRAIGNQAYGGRMGNTGPNDGYDNRGQGLLQTTGHNNIMELAKYLNVSFEEAHRMLTAPDHMFRMAVATFAFRGAIPPSQANDIVASTKRVNGGKNGLYERAAALKITTRVLK